MKGSRLDVWSRSRPNPGCCSCLEGEEDRVEGLGGPPLLEGLAGVQRRDGDGVWTP